MTTVVNLSRAGEVRDAVVRACERLQVCGEGRIASIDRAMHILRAGGSTAYAISEGRGLARSLARAAMRDSKEPA